MLLIDSLYINSSGGLILLNYLIEHIESSRTPCTYLIDERNPTDYRFIKQNSVVRSKASVKSRKKYYKQLNPGITKVLCFGNIPPPQALSRITVYTYLHQYFYIDASQSKKSPLNRIKFWLKRKYLNSNMPNTDEIWVQSTHMKDDFQTKLNTTKEIRILPFYQSSLTLDRVGKVPKKPDFVYISNANPHKNHNNLIKAWQIFHARFPETMLHLTVSKKMYPELAAEIDSLADQNIINHDIVNHETIESMLRDSKYVVYPSLAESFGLVLIEASLAGCQIIAANLPYVNSVITPSLTFDPYDVNSISEALVVAQTQELNNTILKTSDKIDVIIGLLNT